MDDTGRRNGGAADMARQSETGYHGAISMMRTIRALLAPGEENVVPGQLLTGVPILISNDFDRTVSFYGRLGFMEIDRHDDLYLIIRRDGAELHFRPQPDHDPATSPHSAYVRILNVPALGEEWSALAIPGEGIPRYIPPVLQPWGMIELSIRDTEGNLLIFGAAFEGDGKA